MHRLKRAFGAVLATTVIGSGVGFGAAATAATVSAAPQPTSPQRGLFDVLSIVTAPLLSGTPGIGSALTLTAPIWSLPGVSNSFQWMRDGVPIPGATGSSYTPSAADAGSQITALVTGSLLGVLPISTLTNAIGIPLPPGGGGGGETPSPFTLLGLPTLTGIPGVGEVIGLTSVVWSAPGVSTGIQWLSNGVPIPGANDFTFIPGSELAGTQLSALITGTLAGLPVVSQIVGPLGIAPAEPDKITPTKAPAVTGVGKVGTLLTGVDPTWSTDGVTTTYQWLRNSIAIAGATQKTYMLLAEDFGKQISLKATGTKGAATGTALSTPVAPKLGDLVASSPAAITGVAKAGSVLSVQPGTWNPTPTFTYQWFRNGAPIEGSREATYVVQLTDSGRNLAVRVTATRPGYTSMEAIAGPAVVAKSASKTTLKLLKKSIKQGTAGLLRISLSPSALRPAGKVKVYDGKKLIRTYTVRRADNGSRIVKLPKLKAGKHRLTAIFAGSASTNVSKSGAVVLKVVKKRKR